MIEWEYRRICLIGERDSNQKKIKLPVAFINMICKVPEKRHRRIYAFSRASLLSLLSSNKKVRHILLARRPFVDFNSGQVFYQVNKLFKAIISWIEIRLFL